MVGIESIVKHAVSANILCEYKGERGWNNIKSGNLNISHLKNTNKRKFKAIKAKYVYFYTLPGLITNPFAVKYDKSKVTPPTNIECEILFYNKVEKDDAIIHLGIASNSDNTYYFPRTFFVEKVNTKDQDIYIANQESINVSVTNRIITL